MPSEERLALVVGCGSYDDPSLQALQATLTDVGAIETVLNDDRICRFTSCKSITDQSKSVVEKEVHRFLKAAPFDSLVLLYFTGHGIKDENGALYFAQKDTESDLLESTAVSADFIRRQMDACVSTRKVLLLDCCFAGAFPKGAKSGRAAVDIEQQFAGEIRRGRGFFVISATGEYQYAYSAGSQLEALSDSPEPSVFTKHLVHGLRSGDADTDNNGLIKVSELFDYLQKKVGAERPNQTPKMAADVEEDFVIALVPPEPGDDVVVPLEIEPAEAKVGTSVTQGLPNGESVTLEVKPDSAPGDRIVVEGKGEPGNHGGKPGNVVFEIRFPTRDPVAGANLFAKASISAEEAESGCATTVRYAAGMISIEVPPGTVDGATISIPGKGQLGQHGGPSGNLIVSIEVAPGLPERGKDYAYVLSLTPEEAAAGCSKPIATPVNPLFEVSVPSGTPDGYGFKPMPGLGHPGRFGGQPGDLLISVQIAYPPAENRHYVLELTSEEARLGVVRPITGPWGSFEYAVPANSPNGRVVSIKGMGEPGAYGRPAGDLVITYRVKDPELPAEKEEQPAPVVKIESTEHDKLIAELIEAQGQLANHEQDLKSGKIINPWAAVGLTIFYPVFFYVAYLLVKWLVNLDFIPKAVTEFVDPKLPFVAILLTVFCCLAGIMMFIDGLGGMSKRNRLRENVSRLEKAAAEAAPK